MIIDNLSKKLKSESNSINNNSLKEFDNNKIKNSQKTFPIKSFPALTLLPLILLLFSSAAFAIPDSLTLQGKLTNLAGASQSGTYNFTFRIYDAATDGNALWELANYNITTDANGIYDVILGNINLNFSEQYYLGITVSTDNESLPRVNLTSSPYSFRANTSEALNPGNNYFVTNLSVAGNMSIGSGETTLEVSTQAFNLTKSGNIIAAGNLTFGDQIKFRFGQIIDNLVNGFLRVSGSLNVTGNLSIAQDALFVDNNTRFVGIGTAFPNEALEVIGNVRISGSLNATNINASRYYARNGTVSEPSYSFIEDTNTGIMKTSEDNLTFVTGGVARLTINGSGYVGIGTAGPRGVLHVNAGVGAQLIFEAESNDMQLRSVDDDLSQGGLKYDAYRHVFEILGTERMRIATDGNVGINTSTPSDTLTVNGTMNIRPLGTSALFVASSGNVGIGTSAPAEALVVIGNVNISGTLNVSDFAYFGKGVNITGGLTVASLNAGSCDLKADADGNFYCGSDAIGGAPDTSIYFRKENLTDFFGDTSFNSSVLRVSNMTNIRESLFNLGNASKLPFSNYTSENFTSQYDVRTDRWLIGNLTNYLGGADVNASIIKAGNLSTVLSNTNGSLWNRSLSNITPSMAHLNVSAGSLFVDTTNARVGIGTTNPFDKLVVSGGALHVTGSYNSLSGSEAVMDYSTLAGLGYGARIWSSGADSSTFGTFRVTLSKSGGVSSFTPFVIDGTGNVGIGTTSPLSLLHLNKSDLLNTSVTNILTLDHTNPNGVNLTGGIGVSILFRANDNASQLYNIGNISAILYNSTNGSQLGAITFSTVGSDTGDGSKGHLTEKMRIDGTGRIGINNTLPNATLDVSGNVFLSAPNPILNLSGPVMSKSGNDMVISD